MDDPTSPQGQAQAESQRRMAEKRQSWEAQDAMMAEQERRFKESQEDYYRTLREENSGIPGIGNYRDEDLPFLNQLRQVIETSKDNPDVDPQFLIERAQAARVYSNLFEIDIGTAFMNLENLHQQWTGQNFVRKTGVQAVMDSVQLSFLNREYNQIAQQAARHRQRTGEDDPGLLQALYEREQRLDQLRDHAPKPWQKDYVSMGGFFQDAGQWLRAAAVFTGENAVQIGEGIIAAGIAATGAGAIAQAAGLAARTSGLLISGASRLAIAGSTYHSTWGLKYREMRNAGFSHDIAMTHAQSDAVLEGIIEGSLGGLEAAGGRGLARAVVPQAVSKATNRWFISGKAGTASRHFLNWLKEGGQEFSEEFLQAISSGNVFNEAVDEHYRQREQELRDIYSEFGEDLRGELEKEIIEKYPDIEKKKLDEILHEGVEGGIGAFLSALILGGFGEGIGYRSDVRAAQQLAGMAQAAPNEAVFKEMVTTAKEQGYKLPIEGDLKTDEEAALLDDIFKVQQERLTPEQRAEKAKQAQDAEALAEITDYRNTETVQRTEEYEDENGKKNQETITELARPNEKVYKEDGKLEIEEYTNTNEDGSINGSFVAGDPRIEDEDQAGTNQYGYIIYTKNGDTITIDEFKMVSGYENLRGDLWSQFTEKFGNVNYIWNPKHEQNIAIRDELIKNNPNGPKNGLNYRNVSREAQQIARKFTQLMPKGTSNLEVAMSVEWLNTRKLKGESLTGAFNRLVGRITNDPNDNPNGDIIAAQLKGTRVQGATWFERTAEGMRRVVYVSKHASNPSTVIHEVLLHAVEGDLTHDERMSAIKALNGWEMKRGPKAGQTLYFNDNYKSWNKETWVDFSEAFAEAGEIYFTHGTAPSEEMKTLFEKIKEFMKRIYEQMKGWTELSPEVDKFFQSLFNNETDQAGTEVQAHEEARGETQTEKTENDKAANEKTRQRDEIIDSPDIPLEEKAQYVMDAADDALYQVSEAAAEQLNGIYDQYHNKDGTPKEGWLKATNGKDTNLTERQWLAVRTELFKNWFGDWENDPNNASKIIDENGEPKVVYHGTNALFDVFDPTKSGSKSQTGAPDGTFFFTNREDVAESYTIEWQGDWSSKKYENANVIAVFLNIRNPLKVNAKGETWQDIVYKNEYYTINELAEYAIKSSKHDGLIVNKVVDKGRGNVEYKGKNYGSTYTAFKSNQIKSATDNAGTFNPMNPSILFQTGWHGSPFVFNSFDNSKIGTGVGAQIYGYGHYIASERHLGEAYKKQQSLKKGTQGRLYEVSIPDDDVLLHFEKRISNQPEAVQKMIDRLITWKEDGSSNFNQQYNINRLSDGYRFNKSIKGKVNFKTLAEATAAAKAEIQSTFTGAMFYKLLADKYNPEMASKLLNTLGIKGNKYLVNNSTTTKKSAYNYVIFGGSEIQITQTLFQIIGEQGAEAIDKATESTTRLDNLNIARQMEEAGKEALTIRQATGWERGADGKWRYEIPDITFGWIAQSRISMGGKEGALLGNILSGDGGLFTAYPQLKNVTVFADDNISDSAYYDSENNKIGIPHALLNENLAERLKKTLVHEIQHAIQRIEGFSRGGNLTQFKQENNKLYILGDIIEARRKAFKEIPENLKEDAQRINREEDTDGSSLARIQADPKAKAAWADYLRAIRDEEEVRATPDEKFDGLTAYEQYRRLAGEVEARNAATRIERPYRHRTLLADTEDVAREDQIIIQDGKDIINKAYNTLFQPAFHGSPHKFDRFDNSHMGEGEGAQAFGWGHYFAGSKELAEYYRETLSSRTGQFEEMNDKKFSGRTMAEWYKHWEKGVYNKKPTEARSLFDRMAMIENLMVNYDYKNTLKEARENEYAPEAIAWFEKIFEKEFKTPGQLYEVDIPSDDELLDWDKKISEQPELIKRIIINNAEKIFNFRTREIDNAKTARIDLDFGNGKYYDAETTEALINKIFEGSSDGSDLYHTIGINLGSKKAASEYLNSLGIKGIRYLDGNSRAAGEGSHNYVIFDDSDINITQTFFQFGDRDMLEEAADFEDGKDYRGYIETFGELPQELEGLTDEQINAWFNEFVKKAKQAVKSSGQIETGAETIEIGNKELTPAEKDKDFKEIISAPGELENFVETAVQMLNEDYSQWGAEEGSEEAEYRDRQVETSRELRRIFGHTTWQTIILNKGKIATPEQRKQVLTMIKNEPRTYRKLYAEVMEREDLTVSPEDMTAEILKNRITDSRRQDVDSLTPEKLRQLAQELDIEDFAEKVRTGKAKFNEEIEKAYIKKLQEQIQKTEAELKEAEEDRQEDNNYIERQAGEEFNKKWKKVLSQREYLTRENKQLEKAIKNGERDAARIAMRLQRNKANYDSLVQDLQALSRVQQLELDIKEILAVETLKDYKKSAKAEATLQKHLAATSAVEKLKAHQEEIKKQRETLKALNKDKVSAVRRTLRSITPQQVNAEQGIAVAAIQKFAEPSMLEGLDRTIDDYNKPDLREFFGRWKTDEKLRSEILNDEKNRHKFTQEKITSLFSKEKFEDLTDKDRQYLYNKLPPNNTVIGLKGRSIRRDNNYPNINEETAKQIASKYLPPDVYQRIIDKSYSEWTLSEAEELAKIVDDLTVLGKELYKANIDAERKRIQAYRTEVMKTIRTVVKKGKVLNDSDEVEKILGKYKEGAGGLSQTINKRLNMKGVLFKYADMNVYRFTRMLDNGETNGKNMSILYRGARNAHNQELSAMNFRANKIYEVMKKQEITEKDLWQKAFEIDLGGDLGITKFTAAEAMGFIYASENEYSKDAIIGGNLLSEYERGEYQVKGITPEETTPLKMLADDRFFKVMAEAQKFLEANQKFKPLMDALAADFAMSGERVSEFLTRYNNNVMRKEKNYFPIMRTQAVSSNSADAQLARELMGSSAGAFNVFVEKGFTKERNEIPIQYQTAIKLDIFGVWTEAMERQEHFISHGQLVKDLNQIYKKSRPVRDTIQRRYGQDAMTYIDKFINELADPNPQTTLSTMDRIVRKIRGNTAAAYLGWKTSSILKQAITSPAPFFAYMNPLEYYAVQIEYAASHTKLWNEILELSPYMGSRSVSLMIDLVKEQAAHRSDNKAVNALNDFNKLGMKGLEWIDRTCVAPGWLVLFRKEYKRLTAEPSNANISEKDLRVKAAQYADDIVSLTQPSSWHGDLPMLFKGNNEWAKAFLQFTQSLSMIWQNIRYDMPQMMRDRQYRQWAGTIIGYTVAGIMLGAITQWFDDDDDEEMKARKLAWWATTQFTDSFPVIGSEITRLTQQAITGEKNWQGGVRNMFPVLEKGYNAVSTGITAAQEKDFDKLLKASAQAFEAAAIYKGLPASGFKEGKKLFGIGDGDGELGFNPLALSGRR